MHAHLFVSLCLQRLVFILQPSICSFPASIIHIIVTYSYHFNCRIFIRRFSSFPIVAVPSSRLIRLVL